MKIVDVNPFFYPFYGGIEHRMHLIAKELVSRGHDVIIVTGQLKGTELEETSADGYKIIRLPSKFINVYNPPYITSKGLLEKLNEIDADIVNFNYRWAPSYTKDMRKYQGKKVFTYHNMWGEGIGIQHTMSEFNDNRFRKTLKTFDHIIAVSDYVRDDLIRRGIPSDEITTACPCLEKYPELSDEEGDYILSLGRLVRTKGLDYLIEAMKDIDHKLIIRDHIIFIKMFCEPSYGRFPVDTKLRIFQFYSGFSVYPFKVRTLFFKMAATLIVLTVRNFMFDRMMLIRVSVVTI